MSIHGLSWCSHMEALISLQNVAVRYKRSGSLFRKKIYFDALKSISLEELVIQPSIHADLRKILAADIFPILEAV